MSFSCERGQHISFSVNAYSAISLLAMFAPFIPLYDILILIRTTCVLMRAQREQEHRPLQWIAMHNK